jgi:hypothetical protein
MNTKHLNDFLEINETDSSVSVGDLVGEYTRLAIEYSSDGFMPSSFDYDLAYRVVVDKYRGVGK